MQTSIVGDVRGTRVTGSLTGTATDRLEAAQ